MRFRMKVAICGALTLDAYQRVAWGVVGVGCRGVDFAEEEGNFNWKFNLSLHCHGPQAVLLVLVRARPSSWPLPLQLPLQLP